MSVHKIFDTPKDVQDDVYELVKLVADPKNGRLKKGSNEVTKAAERGTAKMIVMAENVNPSELLAHIPLICKEKGVPFIYVEDQAYLAEAAGMNAGSKTAAIALMEVNKGAQSAFDGIKSHTDSLN
ncbi:MAG: ribosomal L7Ae/L30e/S12e/Gadd45 family protein [Candidatus Thermoplasmatota archaeon]|nr:ribosomal L7Ae/L30e/S12e/Gadd45 family protein [Candidatus Thermoplasmatota archaeon]